MDLYELYENLILKADNNNMERLVKYQIEVSIDIINTTNNPTPMIKLQHNSFILTFIKYKCYACKHFYNKMSKM